MVRLWLLKVTVAVCLKSVKASISIFHVRKPWNDLIQHRGKGWSLIVKAREESRSPDKWFKRPCCQHSIKCQPDFNTNLSSGAVSNSAIFLSGVSTCDWSGIFLLFFPLRKLWVLPLSRKTPHQTCKRFNSLSTLCTSCWDADSLVSMSCFSSPYAEVAKSVL